MAFDQDKPAANTSLRVSNPQILDNQEALQDAINREHVFSGTDAGTQTGDHTQGSARCFFTDTAPATRIDGNNFLETDNGSLWIDTDDNAFYMLTDYSQAVAADKWTPISTELYESFLADPRVFLDTLGVDGNFEVGTGSEFTVEAATGNVATDGTLDVAGAAEVVGIAILGDGSTLKTSAAPTADAEIANKKYVDDGGMRDINGTPTVVHTKYFTGTLDVASSTAIAHGIADYTKILSVTGHVFDSAITRFLVSDYDQSGLENHGWELQYASVSIIFATVESLSQGEAYRVKVEYYD